MKIKIETKDRYLFGKLFLELTEMPGVSVTDGEEYDILFSDDGVNISATLPDGEICGILPRDYALGAAAAVVARAGAPGLSIDAAGRCAVLCGERIKLTDIEYKIYSLLFSAGGGYVPGEEIIDSVWGGDGSRGRLNVYIHYLREKLERYGRRVISSSRGGGYALIFGEETEK